MRREDRVTTGKDGPRRSVRRFVDFTRFDGSDRPGELDDLRGRLARAEADADRARHQVAAAYKDGRVAGTAATVRSIAPALDTLASAVEAARSADSRAPASRAALVEALERTQRQFEEALRSVGVETLNPANGRFDPTQHEAVSVDRESALPTGEVVALAHPGYRLGDRLIRPARVVVAGPRLDVSG